jgi:hypothetical protein
MDVTLEVGTSKVAGQVHCKIKCDDVDWIQLSSGM